MKNKSLLLFTCSLVFGLVLYRSAQAAPSTVTQEAMRSPVNKVFQFTQSGDFTGWADGSKTSARSYLWIPEECKKLKGLLILCANVPEQMLAGHEAMRKACAENDLGIVWGQTRSRKMQSQSLFSSNCSMALPRPPAIPRWPRFPGFRSGNRVTC